MCPLFQYHPHPDLVGIDNIGGSSAGVASALREVGKARPLVFIGHGLRDDTRGLLIDGTMDVVFSQDPVTIVQNVCHVFFNIYKWFSPNDHIAEIAMRIICRENLP